MRIVLQSEDDPAALTIAAAPRRGGLAPADESEECDLLVTLGGHAAPRVCLRAGPLLLDLVARRAALAGAPLHLSPIEFRLLAVLAGAAAPLSRDDLLRRVWGYRFDTGTNIVAVHAARLRAKLGPALLPAGRAGYRLAYA